jgi:hypothetical protein
MWKQLLIRPYCGRGALLALCLLLALAGGAPDPVRAAPLLLPQQDAFVDPNNPTTVYNGDRLELTFSNFPGFAPTRRSLLQFELTGEAADLTGAQLQLTVVENNINPNSTVAVALYGAADGWAESSVSWETRPLEAALLQTVTVAGGATGAVTFDAAAVGAYLESERGGDGVASVYLQLSGGDGALGFGGNLYFEDREGSADGVNGNEPTLILPTGPLPEQLYLPLIQNR